MAKPKINQEILAEANDLDVEKRIKQIQKKVPILTKSVPENIPEKVVPPPQEMVLDEKQLMKFIADLLPEAISKHGLTTESVETDFVESTIGNKTVITKAILSVHMEIPEQGGLKKRLEFGAEANIGDEDNLRSVQLMMFAECLNNVSDAINMIT